MPEFEPMLTSIQITKKLTNLQAQKAVIFTPSEPAESEKEKEEPEPGAVYPPAISAWRSKSMSDKEFRNTKLQLYHGRRLYFDN